MHVHVLCVTIIGMTVDGADTTAMTICPACGAPVRDAGARFCASCGERLTSDEALVPPSAPPQPAPLWRRLVAFLVDATIITVPLYAVAWWFGDTWVGSGESAYVREEGIDYATVMFLILIAPPLAALCWRLWAGRTPGKRLVSIRVVGEGGHPLKTGQALGRAYLMAVFLWIFPMVLLDVAWAVARRDRRTLHDLGASTRVVRDPGRASPTT
jgi:uncharacterized RDD family membrane protein YckC